MEGQLKNKIMPNVIIKGKRYNCFDVFEKREDAFARQKTISNNSSVHKTDDGKFALFIKTVDVTNTF